jgi:hypothetical protein
MSEILVTPDGENLMQENSLVAQILRQGGGEDLVSSNGGEEIYKNKNSNIYLLGGAAWKFFNKNSHEKPKSLVKAYNFLFDLIKKEKISLPENIRPKLLKIFAYSGDLLLFEEIPKDFKTDHGSAKSLPLFIALDKYLSSGKFLALEVMLREEKKTLELIIFDVRLGVCGSLPETDESLIGKPISEI